MAKRLFPVLVFVWDDAKAASNLAKHDVSFVHSTRVFSDDLRVDIDASREQEGEERRKTTGRIDGRCYSVVYVVRQGVIRVIPARRANTQEERNYGNI